jgi:hypothetical protein
MDVEIGDRDRADNRHAVIPAVAEVEEERHVAEQRGGGEDPRAEVSAIAMQPENE